MDRGFFRLHPGSRSEGCVTVDKRYPDNWTILSQAINDTKVTEQVKVTSWKTIPYLSHVANFPRGGRYASYNENLTKYGTLYVVD